MIVGRRHTERTGKLLGTEDGGPQLREGRAPCLVAFHGFTGTTSEIRTTLDEVSAHGFAVHAPLLPGHGSSPHRLQDTTFDDWTQAMQAELDAARARHGGVVLCGFSLGSLVAIELAARAPEDILGLVLLGNAVTLSAPVRAALGFVDRRGWTLPDWYLVKLWSSDIRDPSQKKRLVTYDRDPLRAALEVYRAGVHARRRLPAITAPTLVLHGARDRVCPHANVEIVRSAIGARDVRTRIFPRSGHLVAADFDRTEVAREVVRFVAEMGAPDAGSAS